MCCGRAFFFHVWIISHLLALMSMCCFFSLGGPNETGLDWARVYTTVSRLWKAGPPSNTATVFHPDMDTGGTQRKRGQNAVAMTRPHPIPTQADANDTHPRLWSRTARGRLCRAEDWRVRSARWGGGLCPVFRQPLGSAR